MGQAGSSLWFLAAFGEWIKGAWPLSLLIALERLLALTVLGETGGSHGNRAPGSQADFQ